MHLLLDCGIRNEPPLLLPITFSCTRKPAITGQTVKIPPLYEFAVPFFFDENNLLYNNNTKGIEVKDKTTLIL